MIHTVLRTDGVLRLVLNANLFRGMNFEIAQDPRYVKFGIIVNGKVVLHTLRVGYLICVMAHSTKKPSLSWEA